MRLRGLRLVGYASADFGKECFWRIFETFSLFYLTQHLGLAPAAAGALILLSLISDAVWDPAVGALIDSRSARGRSYRPYFLFAPVLCAGALIGLFCVHLLPWRGAAVILAALLLFRAFYAFVDVPVNALAARLALDGRTRSLAWGYKKGFAAIAGLAIAGIVALVHTNEARGLALSILALSPIAIAAYALSWASVAGIEQGHRIAQDSPPPPRVGLRALGHGPIWLLATIMLSNAAFTPIFFKAMPFLQAHEGDAWLPSAMTAFSIGNLVAVPVVTGIALKLGRRRTLAAIFATLICVTGALAVSDLSAWPGLLAITALGCAAAGVSMVLWSMTPDLLDHIPLADRARVQGRILALCSVAVKIGVGVSALTLGGVLQIVEREATTVPLQVVVAAASAIGALIGLILLTRYPLGDRETGAGTSPAP